MKRVKLFALISLLFIGLGHAWGANTLVNFIGGTSNDLTSLDYVSASGLGSDYAESNAPYRVKLDNTGDYILLSLPSTPTSIEIEVKMLGGATTSSIAIKECATESGTFTTVETMSISGAQNSVISFTSSKTFTQKFIKLEFTKGSNVGLGKLVVYSSSGGVTYTEVLFQQAGTPAHPDRLCIPKLFVPN